MNNTGRVPDTPAHKATGARGLRTASRRFLAAHVESPVTSLLSRLGFTPNLLTLTGLVVAGASALLSGTGLLLASGIVLLASGAFDLFDGAVARATDRASSFGALLDSVVDRVGEMVVLLGVLVFYVNVQPSTAGIILVYLAVSASVMVSYLRARAESLGIECEDGVMTRPERVVTLAAGLVIAQWWNPALLIALTAMTALTMLTAAQRLATVRRGLQASR